MLIKLAIVEHWKYLSFPTPLHKILGSLTEDKNVFSF